VLRPSRGRKVTDMHARVYFYRVKPGTLDDTLAQVRAEFLPMMREQPGLRRYTAVRTGPDSFISLIGWDTREQAEKPAETLTRWVRENIGPTVVSAESRIGEVDLLHGQSSPDKTPTYAVVLVHTPKSDAPDLTEKMRAEFIPLFEQQPGFNVFARIRMDDGTRVTYVGWDSREALGKAQPALSHWGDEHVTPHMLSGTAQPGEVVWTVRNE
jgi:heme-degrading monooxygenase HmoA